MRYIMPYNATGNMPKLMCEMITTGITIHLVHCQYGVSPAGIPGVKTTVNRYTTA